MNCFFITEHTKTLINTKEIISCLMIPKKIIFQGGTKNIKTICYLIIILCILFGIIGSLLVHTIGTIKDNKIKKNLQQYNMDMYLSEKESKKCIMKSSFEIASSMVQIEDNKTTHIKKAIVYSELSDGVSKFLGTSDVDTWNDVRNSPMGNQKYDNWTDYSKGILAAYNAKEGDLYVISRSYFPFDTSILGPQAVIQYASLHIYGMLTNESSVCVVSWQDGADGVDYDDYGFIGTINFGNTSSWEIDTYNEIVLNENGISSISKNGFTYFCCREYAHDFLDVQPYGEQLDEHRNGHYFADEPGTDKDPYLYIEYYIDPSIDINQDIPQNQGLSIPFIIGMLVIVIILMLSGIILYNKRKK
jgi:hypothetical protein